MDTQCPAAAKRERIERRIVFRTSQQQNGPRLPSGLAKGTFDTFLGRSRHESSRLPLGNRVPDETRPTLRVRPRNRTSGENNPEIARSGVTSAPLNDRIVTEDYGFGRSRRGARNGARPRDARRPVRSSHVHFDGGSRLLETLAPPPFRRGRRASPPIAEAGSKFFFLIIFR